MAPGVQLGRIAIVAQLALAGLLTALLLGLSHSSLDAVPRPVALLGLYAAPGIVGALGVIGRRRSLLFAAGVVLLPGSILSFTGVTLVFALPLALFWAAAATMGRPAATPSRAGELAELTVAAGLMIAAGIALFAFAGSGCNSSGAIYGSGFLTLEGVTTEVVLLIAAVGFAAWRVPGREGSE